MLKSEKGGKSALDGFRYERNIIAFLSVRMYCRKENILKIICEYKNDIEVVYVKEGIWSWQIKRTDDSKLSKQEILKSIELFNSISTSDTYSNFVLFCNKDLVYTKLKKLELYTLKDLENEFPDFSNILQGKNFDQNFLSKLYFMKGPDLEEISAVIKDDMTGIIDKDNFLDQLNTLIDQIWSGITYIKDKRIIKHSESRDIDKQFKTIDRDRLREFNNELDIKLDSDDSIKYINSISDNISYPKVHDKSKIKSLLTDFQDKDFRIDVLQRLENISSESDVYKNKELLEFLQKVSLSEDKNELIHFFYIIDSLLTNSKKFDENSYKKLKIFLEYTECAFTSTDEKFRYCYTKIRDIIMNNSDSKNLCELNWKRIENHLKDISIDEENVMKYSIYNMEFLKHHCPYNNNWKIIINSVNRTEGFRKQVYRSINL